MEFRYRVYGLALESQFELPELSLEANRERRTDVLVRAVSNIATPTRWFDERTLEDGTPWLSLADAPGGMLLRFRGVADFFVDDARSVVSVEANPDTEPHTVRHLLLDNVLPMLLNARGRESLHATAILTARGVCAFLGPSGTGKSTIAASFSEAGYQVVCDDCLPLEATEEGFATTGGYPGLRLTRDSFDFFLGASMSEHLSENRAKSRVFVARAAPHNLPMPVTRLYAIHRDQRADESSIPSVERLSARESFEALVSSVFRLDIRDQQMLVRQFAVLGELASKVGVRRLRIPSRFDALRLARQLVLEDAEVRS